METKHDASYGVIPVINDGSTWKVFILYQISRRGDRFWTFPKGHPERGETPELAARRELAEEAAITLKHLDTSRTFDQQYTFVQEGVRVIKRVSYFLGYAAHESYRLQPEEVADAKWCSFTDAHEFLSFAENKATLDAVVAYLGASPTES